ncbi:hotdog fold domain-containing protein [Streptomyces sp. NPDC041068]|uniref:hotdog fold domain-containing protein n=1 Tax=Streptomyces sp. NPDC041068 TaxID=3155130 RepID=UPI0033FE7EAA
MTEPITEPGPMSTPDLVVTELYQGYPGVAFGGYVAGLLAERATAETVRVDFRAKTPVGEPVRLAGGPGGGALLTDRAGTALAVATPAPEAALTAPPAPSWDEAAAASEAYLAAPPLLAEEDVDCFGCGKRAPGSGLLQHCMPVPGRDMVATAWVPHASFADADGVFRPDLVWAALDCPSAAAGILLGGLRMGAVTAALTGRVLRQVTAGERHITYAWLLHESGRKHTMGVAVATAKGELCALGEALWIDPRT